MAGGEGVSPPLIFFRCGFEPPISGSGGLRPILARLPAPTLNTHFPSIRWSIRNKPSVMLELDRRLHSNELVNDELAE